MIIQKDLKTKCIYCNQNAQLKYKTRAIDQNIQEIVFIDNHVSCAKRQDLIEELHDKIKEQEMVLLHLRSMYATLKCQIIKDTA